MPELMVIKMTFLRRSSHNCFFLIIILDVLILNNLVANPDIQRVWSLQPPPIISKL